LHIIYIVKNLSVALIPLCSAMTFVLFGSNIFRFSREYFPVGFPYPGVYSVDFSRNRSTQNWISHVGPELPLHRTLRAIAYYNLTGTRVHYAV